MRPKQHLLRAPVTAPGGGTPPGLFAGLSVCVALPRHQLAKAGPMGDLLRHAGEADGWWPGAWLRPAVCGLLYRAVVGLVRGRVEEWGPFLATDEEHPGIALLSPCFGLLLHQPS